MENRYTDSVKNAWKFAAEEASKLGSECRDRTSFNRYFK